MTYLFDLSVFQDGGHSPSRLRAEIEAALPGAKAGFRVEDGRTLVVSVSRRLSPAEQTQLQGVLRAHRDDAHDLVTLKAKRFAAVDFKTKRLIAAGFLYQGQRHSLSANAQQTISGLDQMRDDPAMVYPVKFNSLDDTADLVLSDADGVHAFALAAMGAIRTAWESGTALKEQIRAAATVEAVNAIQDMR